MWESCRSFCHFPIAFVLLLGGGFFVCYGIGISNENLQPLPSWPFVSDTGASPPESCIFTLILTWGAFFTLVTMYSYYRYVIQCDGQSKCNIAGVIVGTISCFGITMVGAFQWTNVLAPHLVGAALAFIGAMIYSCIIVYVSWHQLMHKVHKKNVVVLRIVITFLELVSFVVLIVGSILMNNDSAQYKNVATISEWFLIYLAILFVGTLAYDLRYIRSHTLTLGISHIEHPNLQMDEGPSTYQSTGDLHMEP